MSSQATRCDKVWGRRGRIGRAFMHPTFMNPRPAKRRRRGLATAASVVTSEELASVGETQARSIVLAQGKTSVGQHQAAATAALRLIAEERRRFAPVSSRASAVVGALSHGVRMHTTSSTGRTCIY